MIRVDDRASIVLKELSFNYGNEASERDAEYYANMMGKYPYLQLGDDIIETNNTVNIFLYNDQFLPKIEVHFYDSTHRYSDKNFPTDNEILSLFIRSTSEILMPVRMDFKILSFNLLKQKDGLNNKTLYSIIGVLNVNNLYFRNFKSYEDSSINVLKQIARESELGFATNISSTNDKMVWINPGKSNLKFIQNIVEYSYISDTTYTYAFIDFYYNLNYIDIESCLNDDISEQLGITSVGGIYKQESDEIVSDLILTNSENDAGNNKYINKFNLNNSSLDVNLEIGYKSLLTYFDRNGNTIYKIITDSISYTGDQNEKIILKGNVDEITEMSDRVINNDNLGRIDTDNVHKNYIYAKYQNVKNLKSLQKIKVRVTLLLNNYNLYRFQKIMIRFYKNADITGDFKPVNQNSTDDYENILNKRLSGEWIITAINYTFDKINGFKQEVSLTRRDLGFNDKDFQ